MTQTSPLRYLAAAALAITAMVIAWLPSVAHAQSQPTVRFATTLGNIDVTLLPATAPKTVANFLNYVNRGAYDASFVHRAVPGFVIQGGGFRFVNDNVETVAADPPVANEFALSNLRGTLAMAKLGGDPNSATSQWFFNLSDANATNLDVQNGGFTVFGRVANAASLAVMDSIAAAQIINAGSPFDTLPVVNYTGASGTSSNPANVTSNNLVTVNSIRLLVAQSTPDYAIGASPDVLSITSGQTGTTTLTITPINGYSGTINLSCGTLPASASCTFTPTSVTFASGDTTAKTATLTISTSKLSEGPLAVSGAGGGGWPTGFAAGFSALALSAALGLAAYVSGHGKGYRRRWARLPTAVGLSVAAVAGCGDDGGSSAPVATLTPAGTYSVPVVISDGTTQHPLTLTVVVKQAP